MTETPTVADPGRRTPAPDALQRVQDFINTMDIEEQVDRIDSADGLRRYLADSGWGRFAIEAADVKRAADLREALRALALANNGAPPDPDAMRVLDRTAARCRVSLHFDAAGSGLQADSSGVDRALGQMLAIVHYAMHHGTWERLKACRDDNCLWAFYDQSKNRSGTWCSMQVCGNRAKAQRFRLRHHS